jgi:hypothetical protein
MKLKLQEIRQWWNKAQPTKRVAFWIAIGAVLLTIYFGFTQAGWVTGGTALRMAERSSDDVLSSRLAEICVAQFAQDPDRDQKLAEMMEVPTITQRANFVRDQGWATMPGDTEPGN